MIKFFRRIRKSLLQENRFSQYLLYALGEIILVVFGILIALQVNNWNQRRIASNKEQIILKELHLEFEKNKLQLEEVLSNHKSALESCNQIAASFPIDLNTLDINNFQQKFRGFGNLYTFNPSQGIVNSLINTSSFDLVSNDSLRNLLISWQDVLADYQEEEIYAFDNFTNHLRPYFKKHLSPSRGFGDSRIDLKVLTTLEFENHILDRRSNLQGILKNDKGELDIIKNTIDKIIELSKPNDK